jgi:hypothetical protein
VKVGSGPMDGGSAPIEEGSERIDEPTAGG